SHLVGLLNQLSDVRSCHAHVLMVRYHETNATIRPSHPRSTRMTTLNLIWQITWRSAVRILGLGALFGGIYGPSVLSVLLFIYGVQQGVGEFLEPTLQLLNYMLLAALIGGLIGAILGGILGIPIGLMISTITICASRPLSDAPRYVQVVQWSS